MRKHSLTLVALLVCLVFAGCLTKKEEPVVVTLPFTLDLSKTAEGSIPKEMLVHTGDWRVVEDTLECNFPPVAGDGNGGFIHFRGLDVADFDLKVTINFQEVDSNKRFAGLLFRADPNVNLPRHKYLLRQGATASNGVGLLFRGPDVKGDWIKTSALSHDFELGTPYDLRLVAYGNRVKLLVDDVLIQDVETDKWYNETGAIGFAVFGGRIRFSDISIDNVTAEAFDAIGAL
ncbi:MAG: DUF1080 domain-containing protein [Limnochordia bacterium]|nr:DUF1080 domain-containing protein [Limnochordia bacterium]MDD2629408.1 DUF1080 domain-containing protein [Limnochordia bacterium]MDD4518000.1 DUF1080 domain-containing protein [Limnochordia bacterium]